MKVEAGLKSLSNRMLCDRRNVLSLHLNRLFYFIFDCRSIVGAPSRGCAIYIVLLLIVFALPQSACRLNKQVSQHHLDPSFSSWACITGTNFLLLFIPSMVIPRSHNPEPDPQELYLMSP